MKAFYRTVVATAAFVAVTGVHAQVAGTQLIGGNGPAVAGAPARLER